jgi:ribulose kinase
MNPIKKMIIEETVNVLREVKQEKAINELKKNLYESVKTANVVKDNPKKHKVANKIVSITEKKLFNKLNKLNENHGIEDESEMAKAQLLAIMEKAKELYQMLGDNIQLEDWVQYKLSIAENYMDAIHGYMKYFNGGQEMENGTEMKDEMEWDDVEEEDFNDEDFGEEEFEDEEYYDLEDFEDDEYYDDEDMDDEKFSSGI